MVKKSIIWDYAKVDFLFCIKYHCVANPLQISLKMIWHNFRYKEHTIERSEKIVHFLGVLILILMSGCNDSNGNGSKNEQQILENVWTYVKGTDMPIDEEWENAWLNGEIEEIEVSDDITNYIDTKEEYNGQTVLLVTPNFETERMAYPSILVDAETMEVIGEIPGA
jgi:hypothetical protein